MDLLDSQWQIALERDWVARHWDHIVLMESLVLPPEEGV